MESTHLSPVTMVSFLWLIPTFPLIGATINGLFGAKIMRRFGPKANHTIAIALPSLSFIVTCVAMVHLLALPPEARVLLQNCFPFIHVGFFDADMAFWFDPLSATLTCIITFIGTLIHIYSAGYMKGDPGYWRFFAYLNLFMTAMLLLVLGDNFLIMFIGWEGVGLCSYLLISFWYKEKANAAAGMKAFVVNRIGDFGFVLGLGLLFWGLAGNFSPAGFHSGSFHQRPVQTLEQAALHQQSVGDFQFKANDVPPTSLRFDAVRARIDQDKALWQADSKAPNAKKVFGVALITVICLLFFLGATGKSAQIPLYVWLPDAMAGPTPVSALIHAATMVTAGVYMIARLNFLFSLSPMAMTVVALVGALTAFFAATIGLFQHDIKKVLAYSTVSQLGYMFIGVGIGAYWVGIFHLLTHAVFKACLFLGSGSVILGCHHNQDMRKMGGLKKYMPLTHWTYWAACVAITTAPFPLFLIANGFHSKDEILWRAFDAQGHLLIPSSIIWVLGFLGAGLTSFYMWRSYYMTFTGEYRGDTDSSHGHHGGVPHESPRSMTWVLVTLCVLMVGTVFLGFSPLIGGMLHIDALSHPLFETWLYPVVGKATESLSWLSASGHHGEHLGVPVHTWEILLALGSILLTNLTWFAARVLYKDARSQVPWRILTSTKSIIRIPYQLIYNKYKIDELYAMTVVEPLKRLSRVLYAVDQKIINPIIHGVAYTGRFIAQIDRMIDEVLVDGAVNGVANSVAACGRKIRLAQTGKIQTYLAVSIVGLIGLVFLNYLLYP